MHSCLSLALLSEFINPIASVIRDTFHLKRLETRLDSLDGNSQHTTAILSLRTCGYKVWIGSFTRSFSVMRDTALSKATCYCMREVVETNSSSGGLWTEIDQRTRAASV